MKQRLSNLNLFFENLPDNLRKKRILVWGVFFIILIFLIIGMTKIKLNMSMDSFFPEDEPVKISYNKFRAQFGSDESLILVYKAKDNDIFSDKSLKLYDPKTL